MPLPTRRRRELRTPETDALRDACAAEAARRTEQFGYPPFVTSVKDWVHLGGEWRLSYVWLRKVDGEPENRGYRVTIRGRRCEVEAWGPSSHVTYSRNGLVNAGQLTSTLDTVLGRQLRLPEDDTAKAAKALDFLSTLFIDKHNELSTEELVAIDVAKKALSRYLN